jgi:hypothetical protein
MVRPESPSGMSDTGKSVDVFALDCVEALEDLWKELAILDELGRVTGSVDPYSEAERLEGVWAVQRRALEDVKKARDLLLGVRKAVAKVTGLEQEEKEAVERALADEKVSEADGTIHG